MGRYVADHIADARYVEIAGTDHMWFSEHADDVLDEIEEFLTGSLGGRRSRPPLATVLFTDIVDSTATAAELGDTRWRGVLDRHDEIVRRELARFGGHEIDTTGDGFLATFDAPGARDPLRRARSATPSRASDCRSAPACTPARSRCAASRSAGWRCTSAPGSPRSAGAGDLLVSSTVKELVAGSGSPSSTGASTAQGRARGVAALRRRALRGAGSSRSVGLDQ